MGANLDAIRKAIEIAKPIAQEFQTGEIKFYEEGNTTPVLVTTCRLKKPKPSSFDAGDQTRWATKRLLTAKVPLNATTGVIRKGLIVQVSTTDGDPTINHITFRVESSLVAQFAAEREVSLSTEVVATPRIT